MPKYIEEEKVVDVSEKIEGNLEGFWDALYHAANEEEHGEMDINLEMWFEGRLDDLQHSLWLRELGQE